jgi:sugar diacid utilization regulator
MSESLVTAPLDAGRSGADGDLRVLLREAAHPDGPRLVLDRLARRLSASAVLVGPDGRAMHVAPDWPGALLDPMAGDVAAVSAGRVDAVSVDTDGYTACLLPILPGPPRPVLVVARKTHGLQGFSSWERTFVTDAAGALGLAWRVAEAHRRQTRLDWAEAHNREAVLHLLMVGGVAGAQRAAAALGPRLPDVGRVYLVECVGRTVSATAKRCAAASGGTAWIVRCPVYTRHVIVIAPAAPEGGTPKVSGPDEPLAAELRALASAGADCYVGCGQPVPLREIAAGYRQAFHALSVARNRPERYARFRARGELSELLDGVGHAWACRTLGPILSYRPVRGQDPAAEDLLATLRSWLDFQGRATDHLKLHRNTLAARLRHIQRLLERDLSTVDTQSRLYLSLQLLVPPSTPVSEVDVMLDDLLARPEVRHWARLQLDPLAGADPRLMQTLRSWLAHHTQIGAVAADLGASVSGVRKRLLRIEELCGRSLLVGPSARYDLWLALRAASLP